MENTGGYLKIVHDMDWATFSSITSYDKTDNNWNYSLGGNSNPGNVGGVAAFIEGVGGPVGAEQFTLQPQQEHEYEQYSQEFRLVSSNDNRLRWIAGLYYFHEDADMTQNLLFGISGLPYGVGPRGGSLGIWALSGGMGNGQSQQGTFSVAEQSNEVWSPYFHTEYAVTDQLSLTVGLRYTNDSKSMDRLVLGIFDHSSQGADFFWGKSEILAAAAGDPVCDFDGDGNVAADPTSTPDNIATACNQDIGPQEPDLDFEEWGGKVGLDYQFNNNVMVYGSYSRGFRSGKHDIEFNHGPQTGWRRQNVDVEKLDAYELGFKSTLFDDTLQFNASAYFYVWNDQQQFFVGPQGPDFANIDESELKGIELEFKWAPTDTWLIMGGLGLQDTEVTASEDALVAQIGHELPFASDLSFNLVVSKDFVIGDGILTLTGDYQHRSEAKAYAFDRPYVDELRSVDFINARASYVFGPDSDYEISVFGRNLTEQKSCMYKWEIDAFSGTAYCNANEAVAFYGIQGKWNF